MEREVTVHYSAPIKKKAIMEKIIVTDDNFVWKVLTPKEAREMMNIDIEMFSVEDCKGVHVESLLESHIDLEDAIDGGRYICLEVGHIDLSVIEYILRNHRQKRNK
jgi:hypothetical protein